MCRGIKATIANCHLILRKFDKLIPSALEGCVVKQIKSVFAGGIEKPMSPFRNAIRQGEPRAIKIFRPLQ